MSRGKSNPMYGVRGKNAPRWGDHKSLEERKKISDALKGKPKPWLRGKPSGMLGKKQPEEVRERISKNNAKYWLGKNRSDSDKKKMSDARIGVVPWNKGMIGFLAGKSSPRWRGGVSNNPYGMGWGELLKEQIRERFGRVCVLSLESENGRKLCVHHIDGDKDNHSLENLLPLSVNVHMVLHANEEFFEGTLYWKPSNG